MYEPIESALIDIDQRGKQNLIETETERDNIHMSAKFVVVGGGIAGVTCAETVNEHVTLPNTSYFKILHLQVLAF